MGGVLWGGSITVPGTVSSSCAAVGTGGRCEVDFEIYSGQGFTKPADWVLDSFSASLTLTNGPTLEQADIRNPPQPVTGSFELGLYEGGFAPFGGPPMTFAEAARDYSQGSPYAMVRILRGQSVLVDSGQSNPYTVTSATFFPGDDGGNDGTPVDFSLPNFAMLPGGILPAEFYNFNSETSVPLFSVKSASLTLNFHETQAPEPATAGLMGFGLAGFALAQRVWRRTRANSFAAD